MDEAKSINKSLSALGNVIKALTEKKSATHVPYRDSKLTLILQESLGGNSLTALIITCSMSSFNAAETLSTLRFGSRAKKIKNKPTMNMERSPKKLMQMLGEAEEKIKRLSEVINHLNRKITTTLQDPAYKAMVAEFNEFIKKIETNDVQGLYKLLQSGYVEEQQAVSIAPTSPSPVPKDPAAASVSSPAMEAENSYLKNKLEKGKQALITLQIELVEAKKQLEMLKDEKREIEAELRAKVKEAADLMDRLRLAEIHSKKQLEEHIQKLTELELGTENISFNYQKRSREVEQLCKSLDRILFDEGLAKLGSVPGIVLSLIRNRTIEGWQAR